MSKFSMMILLVASSLGFAAMADVINRVQYRCYDATLRVSHGGWRSHEWMAIENCERAQQIYPNNVMYIEEDHY